MPATVSISVGEKIYNASLQDAIDISLPLKSGSENPKAWHAPDPEFSPVTSGDFTGSVKAGSPINFFNVFLNPHGNGTHTECVGHIAPEQFPVNEALGNDFFVAKLQSFEPEKMGKDQFISLQQIKQVDLHDCKAIIIRTLPNSDGKRTRNYSGINPPFIEPKAMEWMVEQGIEHLLIDTPSVDKEEDSGALSAHKTFWNYPENPRMEATISEMIFVPNEIEDGKYLLNIQIPPLVLDAAPSRPFLFPIQ